MGWQQVRVILFFWYSLHQDGTLHLLSDSTPENSLIIALKGFWMTLANTLRQPQ